MKKKIVDIEQHAFFRMLERGSEFGLDYRDTRERVFKTVNLGVKAKRKHLSDRNETYYHYFDDNLSFYVICMKKEFNDYVRYLIKTVIIEEE